MSRIQRFPVLDRIIGAAVAGTLALAPTASWAAPAKADAKEAAPTTVSGTVALLRFTGPEPAADLRTAAQESLQGQGFTVKGVALDAAAAAKKVKCRGREMNESCLQALGKWLGKSAKTAADYVVYGDVVAEGGVKKAHVVLFDVGGGKIVRTFDATLTADDYIVPIVLPKAVGRALAEHVVPPAAATDEEKAILATLDEPEKTTEEIEAEKKRIAEAEAKAAASGAQDVDVSGVVYDMKADFKDFCRTGPRKKRESKDDELDPRPSCKLGPFWGYWQPRSWAFLVLTGAGLAATGALWGVALAGRKPYKDAVSAVEDYEAAVGGDPSRNPNLACMGSTCYQDLALEVSRTSAKVRTFALAGDVALGVTVLFAGVLGIMIGQDRKYARDRLTDQKRVRAMSSLRVAPVLGAGMAGGTLGFRF